MRTTYVGRFVFALSCTAFSGSAIAQGSNESAASNDRVVQGQAFLSPVCANADRLSELVYGAGDAIEVPSLSGGIKGILGPTVGEIGGAAVGLLGNALKKAAESKAYTIESHMSYPFYGAIWPERKGYDEPVPPEKLGSAPTIGCINLISVGAHIDRRAPLLDPRPERDRHMDYNELDNFDDYNLEWEPLDFAMEIELIDRGDALELKPRHIHYINRIGKFPDKRLPAEVQLIFSKPSPQGGDSFAVARIPLRPIRAGETWWDHQLNYTGFLIPLKEQPAVKAQGPNGWTNVNVRFVMYKSENKFLKAVGEILAGKDKDVANYISGEIASKPQWTDAMASYEEGLLELRYAEEDLQEARNSDDQAKIRNAEKEALRAKAKVNSAASRMGRSPPYPVQP